MPLSRRVQAALARKVILRAQGGKGDLAKQVRKNTKQLNAQEIGRLRVTMDATPDTTAVVQNVSFVSQNSDVTGRRGRKIHAKHVSVSGSVVKAATSGATKIRIILFRDNLGTTDAPTLSDLFVDENDFFDGKHRLSNEQPMKRFSIIWDKYIILNEHFDGQLMTAQFSFSKKLNHDILYTGTSTTDEGKNSIWLISGSNEASAVPALTGDIIFRFSDL